MSNVPTKPGYYWHRAIDEGSEEALEWVALRIVRDPNRNDIFRVANSADRGAFVGEVGGEWGPRIPDPDETRELDEHIKHSIRTAHNDVRDRLAEKFMTALLASGEDQRKTTLAEVVGTAYLYADAMLAEKDKQHGMS